MQKVNNELLLTISATCHFARWHTWELGVRQNSCQNTSDAIVQIIQGLLYYFVIQTLLEIRQKRMMQCNVSIETAYNYFNCNLMLIFKLAGIKSIKWFVQNKGDSPTLSYLLNFGVIFPSVLQFVVVVVVVATYKLCSCEEHPQCRRRRNYTRPESRTWKGKE